jgi:hypothetical protein
MLKPNPATPKQSLRDYLTQEIANLDVEDQLIESSEADDKNVSSLTEGSLATKFALRQIIDAGELKKAVLKILWKQPNDRSTHRLCLYILRVFDNPSILEADVVFIQKKEAANRKQRSRWERIKGKIYGIIGTGLIALVTGLLSFFGVL